MQSEFTVAFKAYVRKGDNADKPEIRYFTIDRGAENNFEYLYAKLISVFPCLLRKTFTISWIDNENDYVVVSSDQELRFALSNMSFDLKKFYITMEDSADSSDPGGNGASPSRKRASESSPEHPNIQCDVCNGAIVGFRYKCVVCPDFDLCQACESNCNHPEHFMIRIPIPIKSFHCDVSGSQLGEYVDMFVKKRCETEEPTFGKKHCRDRKSFHKEKSHEDKHHGKHGRHHEKRQFPKFCGKDPEAWVSTFATFMNDFTNLAGDLSFTTQYKPHGCATASANTATSTANASASSAGAAASANAASSSGNAATPSSNADSSSTNGAPPSENADPPSATTSATQQDENAVPKTSGDYIRIVLKDVGVSNSEGNFKMTNKKSNLKMSKNKVEPRTDIEKSIFASIRKNANPFENNGNIFKHNQEAPTSVGSVIFAAAPPEKIDDWTMLNSDESDDSEIISIPRNTEDQVMEKDMDNIVDGFQTHVQVQANEAPARSPIPLPAPDSLIDLTNSISAKSPPSSTTTQTDNPLTDISHPSTNVAPVQPPTAPPPAFDFTPSDPRIARALNQMMSMGFSNDQGVLTHLLESGDGNINRVLDILTSVRK
ncbi:refractory to sigma P [Arctopsyche grandis]|uniref:refractory to sigma P n=1 Tax=Arctopsyche grandis TaxID=121162 RepID=UPI00406D73D2